MRQRRAFSLVELLIVILIIAVVIAIVLPALGHVRTTARKAATLDLMNNISQACSAFQLDNNSRLPGQFRALDMGSAENATRGFTGMENVMYELAGGVVPTNTPPAMAAGPTAANTVWYNGDLVGVAQPGTKAYFTPPPKYYKYQDAALHGSLSGLGTKTASEQGHMYTRDLVDAEGTPLLFWAVDDMAQDPITKNAADAAHFVQVRSGDPRRGPARFYWNSNAAFLNCNAVGDKRKDQTNLSLIGGANTTNAATSMIALLGNPNAPTYLPAAGAAGPDCLPTSARGKFIIQSAGSDCVYMSKDDKGAKSAVQNGVLNYFSGFKSTPSVDLMKDFDDILVPGGA